jgi:hypothetical protein
MGLKYKLCLFYTYRCECLANLISKILQGTIKFKEIHHGNRKFKEIFPDVNDYTTRIQTLQGELPQLLIQVVNRYAFRYDI